MKCKYGDPQCPCQDDVGEENTCHYEGEKPMPYPRLYTEGLEAENKALSESLALYVENYSKLEADNKVLTLASKAIVLTGGTAGIVASQALEDIQEGEK